MALTDMKRQLSELCFRITESACLYYFDTQKRLPFQNLIITLTNTCLPALGMIRMIQLVCMQKFPIKLAFLTWCAFDMQNDLCVSESKKC